ncbi:MAG: hypothetical protein AAGM67_08460 [Bacteroidota bacterium]
MQVITIKRGFEALAYAAKYDTKLYVQTNDGEVTATPSEATTLVDLSTPEGQNSISARVLDNLPMKANRECKSCGCSLQGKVVTTRLHPLTEEDVYLCDDQECVDQFEDDCHEKYEDNFVILVGKHAIAYADDCGIEISHEGEQLSVDEVRNLAKSGHLRVEDLSIETYYQRPVVEIGDLQGPGGNIFQIVAECVVCAKRDGWDTWMINLFRNSIFKQTYENNLAMVRRYFKPFGGL